MCGVAGADAGYLATLLGRIIPSLGTGFIGICWVHNTIKGQNNVRLDSKHYAIALLTTGYLLVPILLHLAGAAKRYPIWGQAEISKLYIYFNYLR